MNKLNPCVVFGCENKTLSKHRFPKPTNNLEIFTKWLSLCGNPNLKTMDPLSVYHSHRICQRHFCQLILAETIVFLQQRFPNFIYQNKSDKQTEETGITSDLLLEETTIDSTSKQLDDEYIDLSNQQTQDVSWAIETLRNTPSTSSPKIREDMGNSETKQDHITIPMKDYLTKVESYEKLKAKVNEQNLTIEYMIKEKEQLKNEIQEITSKEEALKGKLQQYESLEILKVILHINMQITELKEDINKFLNSTVNNEVRAEIDKKKENIRKLMCKLGSNCIKNIPEMRMEDLEKLELDLKDQSLYSKTVNDKECRKVLEDLEDAQLNMSIVIAKHLAKIDKELTTKRSLLDDMQSNQIKYKYEEIKSLLIEQENTLLKHILNSTKDTNVAPKTFKDDTALYSIIICDLPETSTDNIDDAVKIRDILQLFLGLSAVNVKFQRLGYYSSERTRKLKVTFPDMADVAVAVKNRYKLKNSYPSARIYAAKSEYSAPVRKELNTKNTD